MMPPPRRRQLPIALPIALAVALCMLACTRLQPCDGNTCGGHGTCRVAEVSMRGSGTPLDRYEHLRRVEVCDCNGKEGFEFRSVGCGPAAKFKTCLPEPCSRFAQRCGADEVCVSRGPTVSPKCALCPKGQVPDDDHLRCAFPVCLDAPPSCPGGQVCQADGGCGPCPSGLVYDDTSEGCSACPENFAYEAGTCKPQPVDAYLVTKLQIRPADPPEVVGHLNGVVFFQKLWESITEDGYNLIWDQDLMLMLVFPELDDITPPVVPIKTDMDVYDGRFVSSDVWKEVRGFEEPEALRDPRRLEGKANYLPQGLTGEACARAVGVDCNPGHFRGSDVLYSKVPTTAVCAPKLANLRVEYSRDRIATITKKWMVLPYVRDDFLLQAYDVELVFARKPTGLCKQADSGPGAEWPCTGYVGTMRAVLRAFELMQVVRTKAGGGISLDTARLLMGAPDVDIDGDGEPDSYSLQVDMHLTPARYLPRVGEVIGRYKKPGS